MKLITLIHPDVDFAALTLICSSSDTLLLRQDAVYLARRNDIEWPSQHVTVLSSDLAIRQITAVESLSIIDDTEWVKLAAKAAQVILWR